MSDDVDTEYTTDRGVTLHVFRGTSGRRMAMLRGDDGQRIEFEFADVPRLIQTLERALSDARKLEDEQRQQRAAARKKP